jgi:hypothetical protein
MTVGGWLLPVVVGGGCCCKRCYGSRNGEKDSTNCLYLVLECVCVGGSVWEQHVRCRVMTQLGNNIWWRKVKSTSHIHTHVRGWIN